ncbi:MAG: SH3 domain-containing protein [Lachnospiraceae bacterium]|nr:SH3 domain-containing protein [Candidatus Equihabitans merdae]
MNDFREWLSDNLRYILLILGILAVVAALFFGVRALSAHYSASRNGQDFAEDSVLSTTDVPEGQSVASQVESIPTQSGVDVPENKGIVMMTDSPEEVLNLIKHYYGALQNKDVDTLRALVDTLSDADAASVTSAPNVTYSDITAYIASNKNNDFYVVYAYYHYLTEGADGTLPGLSQLSVARDEAGRAYIVTGTTDADKTAFIEEVNASDAAKAVITKVQKEYDQALAAIDQQKAQAEAEAQAQAEAEEKARQEAEAQARAEEEARIKAEEEARAAAEAAAAQAAYEAEHKETPARTTATCNVRESGSYDSRVLIYDLPAGTEVTVIGNTESGWRHIRVNGVEGYVGGKFIAY